MSEKQARRSYIRALRRSAKDYPDSELMIEAFRRSVRLRQVLLAKRQAESADAKRRIDSLLGISE